MNGIKRGIAIDDGMSCIANGEIIEYYEHDKPFPSCLILGISVKNRFIHVVVSKDGMFIYLITAYFQDNER